MAEDRRLYQAGAPAGGATPAPPVGPALGQKSINIMDSVSSSMRS